MRVRVFLGCFRPGFHSIFLHHHYVNSRLYFVGCSFRFSHTLLLLFYCARFGNGLMQNNEIVVHFLRVNLCFNEKSLHSEKTLYIHVFLNDNRSNPLGEIAVKSKDCLR